MQKRYALVTGAEQGLGRAIANELERVHGLVVVNLPGRVCRSTKGLIEKALLAMRTDGYQFDVVVNNFGINHLSWIGQTPESDEEILRVNVLAPYWVINGLVAYGHPPARVINIGSQTARVSQRTTALYCASKAALAHLGRVMARELAPSGWTINTLQPGKIVGTEMSTKTDAQVEELRGWAPADAEEYALKMIPMGRFTTVEEVAKMVGQMTMMPAYVNGTVIDMMGGV